MLRFCKWGLANMWACDFSNNKKAAPGNNRGSLKDDFQFIQKYNAMPLQLGRQFQQ